MCVCVCLSSCIYNIIHVYECALLELTYILTLYFDICSSDSHRSSMLEMEFCVCVQHRIINDTIMSDSQ